MDPNLISRYIQNGKSGKNHQDQILIFPVNPKETEIEGVACLKSLRELPYPTQTSVSVITPPSVTEKVLQDAKSLGIKNMWLQPGSENDACVAFAAANGMNLISGGPCILVSGAQSLAKSKL